MLDKFAKDNKMRMDKYPKGEEKVLSIRKKVNNLFKKFMAFTLLLAVGFSTISCHSKKKNPGGQDANANKMVLNVYSFTSGYKTEWLTEAIKDYEKANENTQY